MNEEESMYKLIMITNVFLKHTNVDIQTFIHQLLNLHLKKNCLWFISFGLWILLIPQIHVFIYSFSTGEICIKSEVYLLSAVPMHSCDKLKTLGKALAAIQQFLNNCCQQDCTIIFLFLLEDELWTDLLWGKVYVLATYVEDKSQLCQCHKDVSLVT